MALIDGPPPNSGGESWPSEGLGTDAAQGQLVPPSVSHRELHFFLLQKTMWHAVAEERYDEAQRLKRELKVLRTYLRTTLVRKLQSRVEKMRVAHERKLQTSALARAQHELAAALAVEDYSAAAQAQHSIEQEEARANSMSGWWKRTIMRRMAWILMQASIRSRVSTMRLLHARALQDPKKRLEHELKAAVDDENFERAVMHIPACVALDSNYYSTFTQALRLGRKESEQTILCLALLDSDRLFYAISSKMMS
jgi:hypothetical protein